MSRTNCCNCGAAIDADLNKCPFCGTTYYDLTWIDVTKREPACLKIKHNNKVLTTMAVPTKLEINIDHLCFGRVPRIDIDVQFAGISEISVTDAEHEA